MKQIAKINRATEGKSWHIIGAVGSYLKIQTHMQELAEGVS